MDSPDSNELFTRSCSSSPAPLLEPTQDKGESVPLSQAAAKKTIPAKRAMVWSRRAWAAIEPAKIRNCFFHTMLFGEDMEIAPVDRHLQEFREEISHNMNLLPRDQQVSLEGFIEPEDENSNIHFHSTDAEILALPVDGTETDAAERGDEEESAEEEEKEDEGPPLPSKKEILAAFDLVMQYIDGDLGPIEYPAEGETYAPTFKALKGWREALHDRILKNMTQPTLSSFLKY
ncbi:MAG: hypothetical protein JOS17DRAFT_780317 [Linnemannia elongata]|nr:MAG: hypothetical protein JOS17DRAFT_780317 [Linnemannia elongata]